MQFQFNSNYEQVRWQQTYIEINTAKNKMKNVQTHNTKMKKNDA